MANKISGGGAESEKAPWAKTNSRFVFYPSWGIHRWLVHLVLDWPVLEVRFGFGLGFVRKALDVFREKLDEYKLDIPDNKHYPNVKFR